MPNLLAQIDPENAAAQWFWWVSLIMVIGAVAVLVIVVVGVGRRWKRRQLNAIDAGREARRAGRAAGRVDAWAASSERYVDHDKLPDEEPFDLDDEREPEDDDDPIHGSAAGEADPMQQDEEDDRDPFGLFSDKPYQDSDDDDEDENDDFDDDDDGDWDDEDDRH